ncbi:MAG: PepSY domain-containing protein, partial [Methanobacterium sp.]
VLVIGVAAAGYQITNNTPKLWQATNPQEQISTDQNSKSTAQSQSGTTKTGSVDSQSQTGGSNVKITPAQAKSIAQKSIEQPGATTGTPKLKTVNGTKIYIVPVIDNGKTAGEIWIDAQTGENIGGAGGAP